MTPLCKEPNASLRETVGRVAGTLSPAATGSSHWSSLDSEDVSAWIHAGRDGSGAASPSPSMARVRAATLLQRACIVYEVGARCEADVVWAQLRGLASDGQRRCTPICSAGTSREALSIHSLRHCRI